MDRTLNLPVDLLFDQLRDIYSVESQIAGTLPDLARLASRSELGELLSEQTSLELQHRRSVSGIFAKHGKKPGDDVSQGMKGLIKGGNEHLDQVSDDTVRDLMIIAHYSRMKYYEIAAYHFATTLAENIGYCDEAETLSSIWEEERDSAHLLHSAAATIFTLA